MTDRFNATTRSKIMSRVRTRGTEPEIQVRKALHAAGFRFRLHDKTLPGTPDILLQRFRWAIFVHGCYWHHHDCSRGRLPTSNVDFWRQKIGRNVERDARKTHQLEDAGWHVHVVWTCRIKQSIQELIEVLKKLEHPND